MLLIHDDQTKLLHRQKQGGPRSHDQFGGGPSFAKYLEPSFGLLSAGKSAVVDVQKRGKMMGQSLDELGGQRDFRNKEKHRLATLEGIGNEMNVHLGLPRSGDAVQQRHTPSLLACPQRSVRLRLVGTQCRQWNRCTGAHLLAGIHHAFVPFPKPFGFHAFDCCRIGICPHQYFLFRDDGIALAVLLLHQLQKRCQNARLLRSSSVQFIQGRAQCCFVAQRLRQLEGAFRLGFVAFFPFFFRDNQLRLHQLIDPTLRVLHVQHFSRFRKLNALAQFNRVEEYLRLGR